MKTVIYDINTKIIKGFGEAQIDPVETYKITNEILEKTPEMNEVKTRRQNLKSKALILSKAKFDLENVFYLASKRLKISDREMGFLVKTNPSEARSKLNSKEMEIYDKAITALSKRQIEFEEVEKDLFDKFKTLEKRKKELITSEAIYFEPKVGEQIIKDIALKKYQKALEKLNPGEKLTIDMDVIKPEKVK